MTTAQIDPVRSARSGLHLWVALLLALLLLVSWFMGYGPGGDKCAPAVQSAATSAGPAVALVPAPTPSPTPAAAASAEASSAATPASAVSLEPVATAVPATTATPAPTPTPDPSPAPAASVSAVPVAKVYFAVEKANLPKSSGRALARVVKYLKAHPRATASVSGFHDPSGNLANNQNLALRRAQAVASGLQILGIPKQRIVLQKPEQTIGSGNSTEARRVEVSVANP